MGGRVTWRMRRDSAARCLGAVTLRPATVAAIASAIRRPLSAAELTLIGERVDRWRWARERAGDVARPVDIATTLRAMVRAEGEAVRDAFDFADPTTRALVNAAIRLDLRVPAPDVFNPTADQIRAAAGIALSTLPKWRAGRRETWAHEVASDVLDLWQALSGPSSQPGARGSYATPITLFARALFAEAGAPRSPAAVAKLLRRHSRAN